MKKVPFKAFWIFCTIALFSSCLGDSKSVSSFGSYVYINQTDNGNLCAVPNQSSIAVVAEELNSLSQGRIYRMEAKMNMSQPVDDALNQYQVVVQAEELNLSEGAMPLPLGEDLRPVSGLDIKDDIAVKTVNVIYSHPYEAFANDVWAFEYNCKIYEGEAKLPNGNMKFVAYLDLDNQSLEGEEGEDSEELEPNQAIVKLFAIRENPDLVNPDEVKVDHKGRVSIDMRALRNHFKNRLANSENEVDECLIVFEFSGADDKGDKAKQPSRIGAFTEGRTLYRMYVE